MSGPFETAGLCSLCEHARTIISDRGSMFLLCRLSSSCPEFPKYPRLPVKTCSGYQNKGGNLNWAEGALAEGLCCYQNRKFFAAHEHWESVWLKLAEPEKSFLQALIQMSAAFYHYQRGNPKGATSLLRRALGTMEHSGLSFAGIDTNRLSNDIRRWIDVLDSGQSPTEISFPQIRIG